MIKLIDRFSAVFANETFLKASVTATLILYGVNLIAKLLCSLYSLFIVDSIFFLFVWPEKYPFPSQQEFLKKAKPILGAERMIWGTDLSSTLNKYTYKEMIEYVTKGNIFSDNELELVMAKNAERAYRIVS